MLQGGFAPSAFTSWLITGVLILVSTLYSLGRWLRNTYVLERQRRMTNSRMPAFPVTTYCAVCERPTTTRCSRCKAAHYCGQAHQTLHWKQGHNKECRPAAAAKSSNGNGTCPSKGPVSKASAGRPLSPSFGGALSSSKSFTVEESGAQKPKKVLFAYEDFLQLFSWKGFQRPPVGLQNCGNSCYANSVLQCLTHTRPLSAYLLCGLHGSNCRREGWCFLCELERHTAWYSKSSASFSPLRIVAQVRNIGNHLGYGRQEDAHEFMRFAVDSMQTVFLDEAGGEKNIDPPTQETTLVHHIFGGRLQSQVKCMECYHESNRYESVLDLAVEIHGAVNSLEAALATFTSSEWLDGDNKYKCDKCKAYVRARKRLTVHEAPNILTITLKRFQTGRFGKLNKRVAFPEVLHMEPYMSSRADTPPAYELYAVVVHLDMLNSTFFGHYLCYVKDSDGCWYMVDDEEVVETSLENVLSQKAYMLFYSRSKPKPHPQVAKPPPAPPSRLVPTGILLTSTPPSSPDTLSTSSASRSPMSEDELGTRLKLSERSSGSEKEELLPGSGLQLCSATEEQRVSNLEPGKPHHHRPTARDGAATENNKALRQGPVTAVLQDPPAANFEGPEALDEVLLDTEVLPEALTPQPPEPSTPSQMKVSVEEPHINTSKVTLQSPPAKRASPLDRLAPPSCSPDTSAQRTPPPKKRIFAPVDTISEHELPIFTYSSPVFETPSAEVSEVEELKLLLKLRPMEDEHKQIAEGMARYVPKGGLEKEAPGQGELDRWQQEEELEKGQSDTAEHCNSEASVPQKLSSPNSEPAESAVEQLQEAQTRQASPSAGGFRKGFFIQQTQMPTGDGQFIENMNDQSKDFAGDASTTSKPAAGGDRTTLSAHSKSIGALGNQSLPKEAFLTTAQAPCERDVLSVAAVGRRQPSHAIKQGRNNACKCNSGKKWKKCCGK